MKVYRIQSFDHRVCDEASEGEHPEYFEPSERAAIDAMSATVVEALAIPDDDDGDAQYPAITPDQSPVECVLEKIELADLPPYKLALACLRRRGWLQHSEKQTVYIDAKGTCRRVWPTTPAVSPSADNQEQS
jgi:hypothetical protein